MKKKEIILFLASCLSAINALSQSISASDLCRDYESNQLMADEKFKSQQIQVAGVINQITKNYKGNYLVILRGHKNGYGIKCVFPKESKNQLLSLKKGNPVKVEGTCKGFGKYENTVNIENCVISGIDRSKNPTEAKFSKRSLVVIEGKKGAGSGFIANFKGKKIIFTNAHVIVQNMKIKLLDCDGNSLLPQNIWLAKNRDLALIELPKNDAHPTLPIAKNVSDIKAFSPITVSGNSMGGGVLTDLHGALQATGPNTIEVSAKFVPGNSGSPIILNSTGEIIGIATYASFIPSSWVTADSGFADKIRRFGVRIDNLQTKDLQKLDLKKYAVDLRRYANLCKDNQLLFAILQDIGDFHFSANYAEHKQAQKLIKDWDSVLKGNSRSKSLSGIYSSIKKITMDSASLCRKKRSRYAYLNKMFDEQIKLNEELIKHLTKYEKIIQKKDREIKDDNSRRRQQL